MPSTSKVAALDYTTNRWWHRKTHSW
jgi:hypothetical protein